MRLAMLPIQIFDLVLQFEGGDTLTEDSRDPGGLTRYGISQRAHPSVDIRNLTREQAHQIYDRDYWRRVRGDDLPLPVALMVFDAAVNQGAVTAVKLLQRAVGVSPDGVLGPVTLKALTGRDSASVCEEIAILRCNRYLTMDSPTEETYERGWVARVVRVLSVAIRWCR